MELVTIGINIDRNLIIQFPIFIKPYIQKPLILYQIETVPVPVVDPNKQANSYTHLQIDRTYIVLNSESCISIKHQKLRTCKKIDSNSKLMTYFMMNTALSITLTV